MHDFRAEALESKYWEEREKRKDYFLSAPKVYPFKEMVECCGLKETLIKILEYLLESAEAEELSLSECREAFTHLPDYTQDALRFQIIDEFIEGEQ